MVRTVASKLTHPIAIAVREFAKLNGKRVVVWHAVDYSSNGELLADTHPPEFVRMLKELSDQKANHAPGITVYADDADAMLGSKSCRLVMRSSQIRAKTCDVRTAHNNQTE